MLAFLNNSLWGIRIWILILFALSILTLIGGLIYYYRWSILRKYHEFRFPEKVVEIFIHFKGGLYKKYYRLIPDDNVFKIDGKTYCYADEAIQRANDFFIRSDDVGFYCYVEGKRYNIDQYKTISRTKKSYSELHYFYNIPTPLMYNFQNKELNFYATDLDKFQENDLFGKLLSLADQNMLIMICIIIGVINCIATFFIIAKLMGWIK